MKKWIWYIVALAAFFFGGWLLGRHHASPEIIETTRIDTVFYERPKSVNISDKVVAVNVPRMLFAPADTVDRLVVIGDSVQISVTERTLEYRDSSYYARVVGPVVGTLSPRLDYIETYNTTTTRTQVLREQYKWSVGPSAGAWAASGNAGIWIGGSAMVNLGRVSIAGTLGYDAHNEGVFGQINAGLYIWRK